MNFIILFKPKMSKVYWKWEGKSLCDFQKYVEDTLGVPTEEVMSFIKEIIIIDPFSEED